MPVASDLRGHVATLRGRIERAGGDPTRVTLVAVTKGFGPQVVRAALDAGLVDLGESYAQELAAKVAELERVAPPVGAPTVGPSPRWHFVGRLQRNKVRKIAPHVVLWHSVDRLSVGAEIARWAPGASVLVQVNTGGEPTKAGCTPQRAPSIVDGLRDLELDVRGLMTMGPAGSAEQSRPAFRALRELAARLELPELSMGMTGDLEVAVAEGATIVRVGTALFGPRPESRGVRN